MRLHEFVPDSARDDHHGDGDAFEPGVRHEHAADIFLGMTGNIDVKLAGNPTKTSTIKVDFGDLSPAATMSAVSSAVFPHAYSKTGTFKVSATVTMPDGSVVSNAAEVSVLP